MPELVYTDGQRISKPIGKADLEHYYGGVVRILAISLAKYSSEEWDKAKTETRIKWLNRAIDLLEEIVNDKTAAMSLISLANNIKGRL